MTNKLKIIDAKAGLTAQEKVRLGLAPDAPENCVVHVSVFKSDRFSAECIDHFYYPFVGSWARNNRDLFWAALTTRANEIITANQANILKNVETIPDLIGIEIDL